MYIFWKATTPQRKSATTYFFNQALREDIPKSHLSMDPVSASVPLVVATHRKISPNLAPGHNNHHHSTSSPSPVELRAAAQPEPTRHLGHESRHQPLAIPQPHSSSFPPLPSVRLEILVVG
jgi:hypothetical protein